MTRDLIVGALFLLAIGVVGYVSLVIQGKPGDSAEYPLNVYFDDVAGLSKGDQIRIRGHKLGEVQDLKYEPKTDRIEVSLLLFRELKPKQGYFFRVKSASALGGNYVDYNPGGGHDIDVSNTMLLGNSEDLFDEIQALVSENREPISNLLNNLENISQKAIDNDNLIGALVADKKLADNVRSSLQSIESFTQDLADSSANPNSLLGAIMKDSEMTNSARKTFENARVISDDLRELSSKISNGEGAIGQLLNNKETEELVIDTIEKIRSAADGVGSIASEVTSGEGIFAKLIGDTEWSSKAESFLDDAAEIAQDVNSTKGSLGKFIKTAELHDQATGLLSSLQESVEDAREQAPINSFVGILFSAF